MSSATYSVAEKGGTVTITATRTGGSYGAASVSYATANGTGTAGSEYTTKSGTLNWAAGDASSKTFTVTILDDGVYDGNKTFTVNLSGATGASLGSPSSATVTIVDNETPPETVSVPTAIAGPTTGDTYESLSGFTASGSASSMGHPLQYCFNWGDGSVSSWSSSAQSHTYTAAGTFQVKAKARCSTHTTVESPWSGALKTVTIQTRAFRLAIDFGTSVSPVAGGYTRATSRTAYSAAQGYGWVASGLADYSRPTGGDLDRDFVYGREAIFLVDLPNGIYSVTVTLGDRGVYNHDQMGVYLQDVQVDTASTGAGQVVTKSYEVAVSDGHLTLRLLDKGGSDPNIVINGLTVEWAAPDTTGPCVVSSSPAGNTPAPVSRVTVVFSEAIDPASFTTAQVISLTDPSGTPTTPTSVNQVSATVFEVVFRSKSALGTCNLRLSQTIRDAAGNAMDQNQNGTNGEDPGDQFTTSFTLLPVPSFPRAF